MALIQATPTVARRESVRCREAAAGIHVAGPQNLVGLISDTHGLVRPEVIQLLRGCELIVHCGDIGGPAVLEALRILAPVRAVRGNIDTGVWASSLPATDVVEVGPHMLYVLHDLADLDRDPAAAGFRAVLSGHSHKPRIEERHGVLFVNPGSAGPRRFTLPVSVAHLVLRSEACEARILQMTP